jgi:YHS domain-containing protein
MKSKLLIASMAGIGFLFGASVIAEVELKGVNCVVAPKAATLDKSAKYKEGQVYFCCGNCQGKFNSEPAKFATKANHQLVASKQYEQKNCPLTGKAVDAAQKTKVGEVEVAFCCGNCKGAVEKQEGDKKLEMVFADKAFDKNFAKVTKK